LVLGEWDFGQDENFGRVIRGDCVQGDSTEQQQEEDRGGGASSELTGGIPEETSAKVASAIVTAVTKDALAGKRIEYDIVLANPPFGKKSSVNIVNEGGRSGEGIAGDQSRRFLGEREKQAAQFSPAHLHHPQAARARGGGVAGQPAVLRTQTRARRSVDQTSLDL
jgi:hypothetical protein